LHECLLRQRPGPLYRQVLHRRLSLHGRTEKRRLLCQRKKKDAQRSCLMATSTISRRWQPQSAAQPATP
jgi:hypothetical protein